MFVSPVLDGWTLVVGTPVSDDELAEHRREPSNDEDEIDEDEHGARQRRCVELSRRLESTVYWYGAEIGEDWTAWCLAENGTLFRYFYDDFRMHEPAVEVGEPLFAEGGLHPPTAPGIGDLLREHAPPEVVEYFIVSEPDIDLYLGSGDDDEYRKDKEAWFDEVQAWLTQAGVEIPQIRHALVIARRTSVDLSELGPGTGVAGSGVLALNACGRVERRRGAFPL
jgi:hypothetical protein